MKKIISIFFVLSIVLCAVISCAETPNPITTSENSIVSTSMSTNGADIPKPNIIAENSNYTLCNIGDENYLIFKDINNTIFGIDSMYGNLRFDSLKDMKNAILNNGLTKEEMAIIYNSFPKNENGIRILDVRKLYAPVTPDGFKTMQVTLSGQTYAFIMQNENAVASFSYLTKDIYTTKYGEFKNFADNSLITIQTTEKILERNATVEWYTTSVAKLKRIYYEINVGETKLTVEEEYVIEHQESFVKTSETVPSTVTIYGENESDGTYFQVYLSYLSERPSVEWLSFFALEEYNE